MTRLNRLTATVLGGCLAATMALAGCSGNTPDDPTTNSSARPYTGCAKVACTGTLAGAGYVIRLPRIWNGTLLLYSHDYRSTTPLPPDYAKPSTKPVAAPDPKVADQLLDSGYALAGSSWATDGWAVEDGIRAAAELNTFFRTRIGVPNRVIVWGDSLGGLVTELLAERHPDWVSGSLPMCAPLAGVLRNQDLVFDVAFAVRTLIYPGLRLTGFTSDAGARAGYDEATRRIQAAARTRTGLARLQLIAALANLPAQTARYDGSTTASKTAATIENVLTAVALGTLGRVSLERKVGGNPAGNVGTDYDARISDRERAAVDSLMPGGTDAALAALRDAGRVTPSAAARAAVARLGIPDGVLHAPTLTLHTVADPLVPVENEQVFGTLVAKSKSRTADLLQLYTQAPARYAAPAPYGAGHCNFTPEEQAGVVISLDRWVKTGQIPSLQNLALLMSGGNEKYRGLSPAYKPGDWPAVG